jgi:hypothetical protein
LFVRFIPNVMKIDQLVLEFRRRDRQHGDVIIVLFSIKGSELTKGNSNHLFPVITMMIIRKHPPRH